jgi:hypothetical protein
MNVVGAWAEVMVLLHLSDSTALGVARTHVNYNHSTYDFCIRELARFDDKTFEAVVRFSRHDFVDLVTSLSPQFDVRPFKTDPKRAPFIVPVLFTCLALAAGVSSWKHWCWNHHVGRATMRSVWMPEVCTAIVRTHPLPGTPRRDDEDAWAGIAATFFHLAAHNVQRDARSRRAWRAGLPTVQCITMFGPIGFVVDGVTTKLAAKTARWRARLVPLQ